MTKSKVARLRKALAAERWESAHGKEELIALTPRDDDSLYVVTVGAAGLILRTTALKAVWSMDVDPDAFVADLRRIITDESVAEEQEQEQEEGT